MARVNLDNGKLADPGDPRVIWEAFKPGSEPSDQVVDGGEEAQNLPADATPAYVPAADYGAGQPGTVPPGSVPPVPGAAANQRPAPPPATSTSGLY
jgi:penicillin-binding protein 1A